MPWKKPSVTDEQMTFIGGLLSASFFTHQFIAFFKFIGYPSRAAGDPPARKRHV